MCIRDRQYCNTWDTKYCITTIPEILNTAILQCLGYHIQQYYNTWDTRFCNIAIPGILQYLKSKILHYCNTWERNTAILGILSIIMLGRLNTAIHRKINTAILQYLGYKILQYQDSKYLSNWLALCSTLGCNSSKWECSSCVEVCGSSTVLLL